MKKSGISFKCVLKLWLFNKCGSEGFKISLWHSRGLDWVGEVPVCHCKSLNSQAICSTQQVLIEWLETKVTLALFPINAVNVLYL